MPLEFEVEEQFETPTGLVNMEYRGVEAVPTFKNGL